jgi:hypothetical protein
LGEGQLQRPEAFIFGTYEPTEGHHTRHALQRASERGALSDEIELTVTEGEDFPAKFGRTGFRRNFDFDADWNGKHYQVKQIEAYSVMDGNHWLVITVIVKYF